jgi:glyoxylase-like metal-dependent hydrolase (beta-lactamase superfamily II)
MTTIGGLSITSVVSDLFAENGYVVQLPGRQDCLVIDPGLNPERFLPVLEDDSLTVAAILNTHGHADHIAGNGALKERFPTAPLIIGRGDAAKLTDANLNLSAPFGFAVTSPPADRLVDEGDIVDFAGIPLEVLEAPGHSCGHVMFLYRGTPLIVFGGDVLFAGSVGRTDIPDGSFAQLKGAIHTKLFTLAGDTIVLPGHGESTTVGQERETNPFVGRRGV